MNQHLEQMQQMRKIVIVSVICMLVLTWYDGGSKVEKKAVEPKKTESVSHKKTTESVESVVKFKSRDEAIESIKNDKNIISFEGSEINGFINLNGARIDNLILKNYKADGDKSKNIALLSPSVAPDYYYIDFGWIAEDLHAKTPNTKSVWKKVSHSNDKIILETEIDKNKFTIELNIIEKYLWNVSMNVSGRNTAFKPYARIKRSMNGEKSSTSYSHEGVSVVQNGILTEVKYADLSTISSNDVNSGWAGFSDKYWFSGIITKDDGYFKTLSYRKNEGCKACYQIDVVNLGEDGKFDFMLFTGAKELGEIEKYKDSYGITLFDRIIDFGWFYFLTKPLLMLIKILYNFSGNFGVAIIMLTILMRLALFPLAQKSYKSMAKLKLVAPQIQTLKEQHKDDKRSFNLAVVALYKQEKVNPASGCLPLFLQIPIFFALYKVLIVSIEMRDAPFIWWIIDLSEADPTSIFNLFGLLPYGVPSFLQIGVLPLIMGGTMYLQQKFSPAPNDPTQARAMKLLPFIFTFLFASFPSGLVLYWSINNILSILQQWYVSRHSDGK